MNSEHKDLIRESYGNRAASYDESHGGWHVKLGQEFVDWLNPQPGETALDLACGTGLVTLPLAKRLGSHGKVVAVDLTSKMIEVGERAMESWKSLATTSDIAPITWLTADITSEDLLSEPEIQRVLDREGGFDNISLCSALVLLADQDKALHFWVDKLLKRGGRVVIDVPTEEITLQYMMTYHLPVAIDLSNALSRGRERITSSRSLADMFETAGLTVEQAFRTNSYLAEVWYESDTDTAMDVLETQVASRHQYIQAKGKMSEARKVWPDLWRKATRKRVDGFQGVEDAHRLYVCIGRKL